MENHNPTRPPSKTHQTVQFQPSGRRIALEPGLNLLQMAQRAGVDLVAACNGVGICGTCKIRVMDGEVNPVSASELKKLTPGELAQGYRLACCTLPLGDVHIEIPRSSLPFGQRLQVDGIEAFVAPDPAIHPIQIELEAPQLSDLRSDVSRVDEALSGKGLPGLSGNLAALDGLSRNLRAHQWSLTLAARKAETRTELAAALPNGSPMLGIAADLGSTKLAVYLMNIETGATLASTGIMNPQISYGEDVVSRIAFANESEDNRRLLQTRLVHTLNETLAALCEQAGAHLGQVVDAVVVGNTAIHHFFCGLPVKQLGESPYIPAVNDPLDFDAREVGLRIAPGARVHVPAVIAGFIGADHTSALLSTQIRQNGHPRVLVDIGTNTEISLAVERRLYSCSTASGPAFEGAHIRDGMRAAPGAIEKVAIADGLPAWTTIEDQPPVGICGTGILSGIAELIKSGMISPIGNLDASQARVTQFNGRPAYVLVPAGESAHGREILITRSDINEIQLAKGAIRTGIEVLLEQADLKAEDISDWIIAGAFGTYLDIPSAVTIGMFPPNLPLERFHQVGNAAGIGAKQMLISRKKRAEASQLIGEIEYIELTVYPNFKQLFLESLYF